MAFRGLNLTGKLVALGVGATAVGGVVTVWAYPHYLDIYKVMFKVNEIPRFKRKMIVDEWEKMQKNPDVDCLLKKYLTADIVEKLKSLKTLRHGNLYMVMQEAISYPKCEIGANAPEVDSYDLFHLVFDPIIAELHNGFGRPKSGAPKKHPGVDWGEAKLNYFENLNKNGEYVKNAKLECYRNMKYFTFQPLMTESDYYQFEYWMARIFDNPNQPDADLHGNFYLFRRMTELDRKNLESSKIMFNNDDERLKAANVYQHWPVGRSVFCNDDKSLIVQMNQEEHLKFITSSKNGDLKPAMERLIKGVKAVESVVPFTIHDRLGCVSFSPRNLGSGLNVSFDLSLPKLSKKSELKETCDKLNLDLRQTDGNITVTNKYKVGLTEYDTAKLVYDGVKKLIELEQSAN